jgi:hypothetical protein
MRNTSLPLYLWIEGYKSINNIKGNSPFPFNCTGKYIFNEVMARYFRIYKTPAYRSYEILEKAMYRYRTTRATIDSLNLYNCIGLVMVDENNNIYATKAMYAKNYADEKMQQKSRKFKDLNLDIKRFYYEIEGVRKNEIWIRR